MFVSTERFGLSGGSAVLRKKYPLDLVFKFFKIISKALFQGDRFTLFFGG